MLSSQLRRCLHRTSKQAGPAVDRCISSTTSAEAAVPAPAEAAKKAKGFFSGFFGSQTPQIVTPLYDPLPSVQRIPPVPSEDKGVETKVTKLENGFTVASEDTPGPSSTVGLFIDAGSVYEHPHNSGVSHLLEKMGFKTTTNRSHFRVVREAEAIGANLMTSVSREQLAYTGDALRTHLPEIVELVADTARNGLYHDWEVKEQMQKVQQEAKNAAGNPQHVMLEGLHQSAYRGALGQPLICPETSFGKLDGQTCRDFVQANFTAPRMVLAASGVDHEDLVALAKPLFEDMAKVEKPPTPASLYEGGEYRQAAVSEVTHVALGFEFEGGWKNVQGSVTATVLQLLLGGGGSFSAGGPGKGMYSRLYTNVLNQHSWVQTCSAFHQCYDNTGLFGIYGAAESQGVGRLVGVMIEELQAISKGQVKDQELKRAKNATVGSVLMNLESRVITAEDIGRQILTYGHRKPTKEFLDMVDKVTVKDLSQLAEKLMKTPLTMGSFGDVTWVPRYGEVAQYFG